MATCSDKGVLNTLSLPNRSNKPTVHLKTPPNLTSSPKQRALQQGKNQHTCLGQHDSSIC